MSGQIITGIRPPARSLPARRVISWMLLALAPLVLAYTLAVIFLSLTTNFAGRPLDISMYYATAAALRAHPGANIYDPAVLAMAARQHPGCVLWPGANYLYPPLLAVLMEPLVSLPFEQVAHYWLLGNLAFWVVDTVLLLSWLRILWPAAVPDPTMRPRERINLWLRGKPDTASLAAVAIFTISVLAWPVLYGALLGQIDLFLLLLLLSAPLLVRRGHEVPAGLLLALAAMFKLFPVVLILYYLACGRRRVVLSALLALAALIGFVLLTAGPPSVLLIDARALLNSGADLIRTGYNESLGEIPIWIAAEFGPPINALTTAVSRLLLVLAALGLGMGLVTIWRSTRREGVPDSVSLGGIREELGYGWAMCAMLLFSPLIWLHYNAWLLFPFVLCMAYDLRCNALSSKRLALYVITYAVLFLPWSYTLDSNAFTVGPYFLGVGLRPLLMLLHPAGVLILTALTWRRSFRVFPARAPLTTTASPCP